MNSSHTIGDLKQMQSLPLSAKIKMTQRRIREWVDEFGEDGVYVSFSGGKDSTVLLDIVRKDYPDIEAIFVNTGLEYPSVRQFALSKQNVTELRPKMNFRDVIIKYGYPIIGKQFCKKLVETKRGSKIAIKNFNGEMKGSLYDYSRYSYVLNAPFNVSHKCCDIMKKQPVSKIKSLPIIGSMAEESTNRLKSWRQNGCNSFESDHPKSNPMSFWTEQDVLTYIHENNLAIAYAYGKVVRDWDKDGLTEGQIDFYEKLSGIDPNCNLPRFHYKTTGCDRTGCIFCAFGLNQDKQRFTRLAEQEPKLCDYVMRGGRFSDNGMWQPNKDGLGYWFVLEWLNVHGNLKIGIPNREYYFSKYCTNENRKYLKENLKEGGKDE